MPIFKCLRRGGSDGTSSSTSGTLSEDSNEQQARKTRNVHLAFSILAGSVLCLSGYERGVLGAVGVGHGFQKTFGTPSALLAAFAITAHDIGCCLGGIAALILGDKLGRKPTLFLSTVVTAIGIALQTGAWKIAPLIISRVITGIGNGASTTTAPVWHVELATQQTKGKAAVKEMIANVVGFLIARLAISASSPLDSEAQWRLPVLLPVISVLPVLILTVMLPESPRWLISKGRDAQAKAVLASLNPDDWEREYDKIRTSAQEESEAGSSRSGLQPRGQALRRPMLGVLLQICQQLTGINLFSYSLDTVLHQTFQYSELQSYNIALGLTSVYAVSALGSLRVIERYGRRSLLMFGAAAQAIALFGIAFCATTGQGLTSSHIALACISMYAIAFGLSWMSIPWVYPIEINSLATRTKGVAAANAASWLESILMALLGSYNLSYNVFLGYGVVNACLVPVVYFLVIETAGQGLEEIDAWVKDHPGWLVRKVKLSAPWKNGSGTQGGGNISPSEEAQVSTDEVGVPDLIPAEEMDITSTSVGE